MFEIKPWENQTFQKPKCSKNRKSLTTIKFSARAHSQLAIYTVFHEESEFAVKNCQIRQLELKNEEKQTQKNYKSFMCFCQFLLVFACFSSFLLVFVGFVRFCLFLLVFAWFCSIFLISACLCSFVLGFASFCLFLLVFANFCQFLSFLLVFASFCQFLLVFARRNSGSQQSALMISR